MDVENDMIVLVVVDDDDDDDEEKTTIITESEIKIEPEFPEESLEESDLIRTTEELGEYIPVKTEPPDNFECDYLEDEVLQV